jgi:hypothetical protein
LGLFSQLHIRNQTGIRSILEAVGHDNVTIRHLSFGSNLTGDSVVFDPEDAAAVRDLLDTTSTTSTTLLESLYPFS